MLKMIMISKCSVIAGSNKRMIIVGNEEDLDVYELHVACKDYCFGRSDQLVGVSVIQFRDIIDQVRSQHYWYDFLDFDYITTPHIWCRIKNIRHI